LGLRISVRGGGHGHARHALAAGALVLDMRDIQTIEIDPARRIGTAGGGALAGEYSQAAGQHGLATGFGDTPDVGIAGLTLGGGVGFLSRRDGLTIDSLRAVELVLADGRTVTAGAEENATGDHRDLFWALRGGGGNFGVVTKLEFALQPVETVLGGMLAFKATKEVLEGAVRLALAAPDELSVMMNLMKAPPMPMLPESVHGELLLMVAPCWSGDRESGSRVLDALHQLAEPVSDQLGEAPYPSLLHGPPPFPEPMVPASASGFVDAVDTWWAQTAIEQVRAAPTTASIQIRPLGGAIARVPSAATAFAHRDRSVMVFAGAVTPNAELLPAAHGWLDSTVSVLGLTGRYVNLMSLESEADLDAAYPGPAMDRLRRVKAAYDPANRFNSNHNIRPAVP
ncbi:MAG TPA: FAD-binding oxidoreductase, partial [Candidatus Agrococcus pullicola]|nr:FAD-binding oxidoreductase [Candidatus Agrococcus pullicola]